MPSAKLEVVKLDKLPTVPVTLPSKVLATIEAYLNVAFAVSMSFKPGSDVKLSKSLNLPSLWSLNNPACLSDPPE